jgi:photosystem II stability/assembly factor-like uncharacterized protein
LTADVGYGFSTVSTGWSAVTLALNKTRDGGKSWAVMGGTTPGSGAIRILPLGEKHLIAFTGQGIVSTQDEGKTWRTEWPAQ